MVEQSQLEQQSQSQSHRDTHDHSKDNWARKEEKRPEPASAVR